MKAFITGVTGQDGYYLSRLLLEKNYEVFGLIRRTSQAHQFPKDVTIVHGDVCDPSLIKVVEAIKPDEVYNLAAMSHVGHSFEIPIQTFSINAMGTLNVLQAAKNVDSKFYQASTSELFGDQPGPQNERTPFRPCSPYGISKLAAFWATVNYRERGLFACNGILFNHESPRRGEDFVTRKVCKAAARIKAGLQERLTLGNLEAKRDWGHAEDFVQAMWLMLQQKNPQDYVVATGKQHSVQDLCGYVFERLGLRWREYIDVTRDNFRPTEVGDLVGDSSKIKSIGWKPMYDFESLIEEMLNNELTSVGLPELGARGNRSDSRSGEVRKLHDGRESIEFRAAVR